MITKQDIVNLFDDERLAPRAVARALMVLYNNQTKDEQRVKETRISNNIGFTSCDANVGTRCAEYFIANKKLLPWMVNFWLKKNTKGTRKITKYHRQLIMASKVDDR